MYNFFFKDEDHLLFKKAFKETKNEPVIINILSTDESLSDNAKKQEKPVVRKNLSNKFQPSPFGKFFGPRKQRTAPIDMGNFSSWKNKNFREVEERLGQVEQEDKPKFSLSDYLNKKSAGKFNEKDQFKSDIQKPIDQLSTEDPIYKKYSLDSYLSKLEEQVKVKDKFSKNDDLLEQIDTKAQTIVPDSSQDENFGFSHSVKLEDITNDEDLSGEKFAIDRSELDSVKFRIAKLEAEAMREKDAAKRKAYAPEITKLTPRDYIKPIKTDDNDDIRAIDEYLDSQEASEFGVNDADKIEIVTTQQVVQPTQKPYRRKYYEINKTPTTASRNQRPVATVVSEQKEAEVVPVDVSGLVQEEASVEQKPVDKNVNVVETGESVETPTTEATTNETNETSESSVNKQRQEVLTKADLKDITDDFMAKFTELYKQKADVDQVAQPAQIVVQQPQGFGDESQFIEPIDQNYVGGPVVMYPYSQSANEQLLQRQHEELQAKFAEMVEANKRTDAEVEEKLRLAELEKQKVAQEYEARLKQLEATFRKKDEETKKKAYLDKLKNDMKLKTVESKFKQREEEIKELEKLSSERVKIGVMLKKELENNLNISILEMDKKLLEISSKMHKEMFDEQKQKTEEIEKRVKEEKPVEEKPKKPRKKTTSKPRTSKRKIDSDIIGGINFD